MARFVTHQKQYRITSPILKFEPSVLARTIYKKLKLQMSLSALSKDEILILKIILLVITKN